MTCQPLCAAEESTDTSSGAVHCSAQDTVRKHLQWEHVLHGPLFYTLSKHFPHSPFECHRSAVNTQTMIQVQTRRSGPDPSIRPSIHRLCYCLTSGNIRVLAAASFSVTAADSSQTMFTAEALRNDSPIVCTSGLLCDFRAQTFKC